MMKNKYIKRSHLSEAKFRQLVKCFSLDLTAMQTAKLVSINRNTVDRIYNLIETGKAVDVLTVQIEKRQGERLDLEAQLAQ